MNRPISVRNREELDRLRLPLEVTLAEVVYAEGAEPIIVSVYQGSGGALNVLGTIVPNATVTRLTFAAEEFDMSSFHPTDTTLRLTAPKAGLYRLGDGRLVHLSEGEVAQSD